LIADAFAELAAAAIIPKDTSPLLHYFAADATPPLITASAS
jgi:hypothetical protein